MKKVNAFIIICTVFIVLVVVNFLASRHSFRLDLTDKHIYTLSDATKNILKGLDDIVTIRVYFTENLPPALQSLRRDVDDILSEFKNAAGDRLQIEFADPSESKIEEQKVALIGIQPVQSNVVEGDKLEVAKVYLGMAVMFSDRQQIIPVVQNINNIEYVLDEAIIKVSSKDLPKIAWWEPGRDKIEEDTGFSIMHSVVSNRYDVVSVTDKILADLDSKHFAALVLVSPKNMSENELFSLDQYLMSGGHLLALIDRFDIGPQLNLIPVETNAYDLIANYGVTIEDSLVLDPSNAMAAFSGGVVTYHLPYPYWPEARKGQFKVGEPIVADLESVVLPWTGPLVIASKDVSDAVLISTTQYATTIPGKGALLDPQSSGEALLKGERGTKPLAALMYGRFGSYYASGKKSSPKERDVVSESEPTAKLFVVGSSHWISDRVLQSFPQNATFFQNALDSFALSDVLIGIRSRESTSRPIIALLDGTRLGLKYFNMLIGPIVVLVIGFVFFMVRRSKRRTIRLAYVGSKNYEN